MCSTLGIFVALLAILVGTYFWRKGGAKTPKLRPITTTFDEQTDSNLAKSKPEKWIKVGRVSKLIVYPVKSCAGVELEEGIITTLGLKCHHSNIWDRHFMVVEENGKYVAMTKYPKMSLIKFDILEGDQLIVTAPNMPSLAFTFPKPNEDNEKSCRLFHDAHLKALDCGDEASQWFQEYLGDSTLRLYYHHLSKSQRTFEPYMYKCPQYEQSDLGAFQNESAYLLIAQESIEELNQRLEKDSSWKNWRPNILIEQVNEPFAEVNWSFVKIGNQNGILKAAVPCKRCPLTTVDHELGIMSKDGEPLKTLRENYGNELVADERLKEVLQNRGIMGIRLGLYPPAGEGHVIKIGDPVYAALL